MTPGSNWKTPKSDSLEDFVLFVLKAAWKFAWLMVLVAFVVYAMRYGLGADLEDPPWNSWPILS